MKKYLVSFLTVVSLFAASTVYALDIETKAAFTGSSSPTGTFYYKLNSSLDLVAGFSSVVPAQKTKQLDVDLKLGLRTAVPLLGKADIYFTFDDYDGVQRTGAHDNSDFYTKSIALSKTWMYSLNDRIGLGVSAVLAEILLEGSKEIHILKDMTPVLGVTITLF